MNRRRVLSSVHRDIARQPRGINAVAWFNSQSFHASAADMPFERLSDADLNKAGASLLPPEQPEPERCAYCGALVNDAHDAVRCAINAENS